MLFGDVVKHKNPMIWNIHNKKLIQEQNSFFNKVKDSTDSKHSEVFEFSISDCLFWKGAKDMASSSFNSGKKIHLFQTPQQSSQTSDFFWTFKGPNCFQCSEGLNFWTFNFSIIQKTRVFCFRVFSLFKSPEQHVLISEFWVLKSQNKNTHQWSKFQ